MLNIKSTTCLIGKKITFVLAVLHIPILHFAYMMKNFNRQQTVNNLHPRQNMKMGIQIKKADKSNEHVTDTY